MSGPGVGKELPLIKSLTTLGKPGVQVAVITKRPQGYFITHVECANFPVLNGRTRSAIMICSRSPASRWNFSSRNSAARNRVALRPVRIIAGMLWRCRVIGAAVNCQPPFAVTLRSQYGNRA